MKNLRLLNINDRKRRSDASFPDTRNIINPINMHEYEIFHEYLMFNRALMWLKICRLKIRLSPARVSLFCHVRSVFSVLFNAFAFSDRNWDFPRAATQTRSKYISSHARSVMFNSLKKIKLKLFSPLKFYVLDRRTCGAGGKVGHVELETCDAVLQHHIAGDRMGILALKRNSFFSMVIHSCIIWEVHDAFLKKFICWKKL